MIGVHSSKWQEAKEHEMKSINTNDVWDLEEISNGAKTVDCNGSIIQRWLQREYRKISKGNIESYKAPLVVKWFTQREGMDYNKLAMILL